MIEPLEILTTKLVLGTVQFGLDYGISNQQGQTTIEEVRKILTAAAESKITILDTAYLYGASEETIGAVASQSKHFQIISKFPKLNDGNTIVDYLNISLQRLQQDRLYGYLAHSADLLLENRALWRELNILKDKGLVSKIGYSLYTLDQLESLLSLGMIPDIVQVPYNIFDRRFENSFEHLKKHQTEIHTRSAFLQGLFFVDPTTLPTFFNSVKTTLLEFRNLFSSTEEMLGTLLSFCLRHPLVDNVVIGVNSALQLKQNIESLKSGRLGEDWSNFQIKDESILLPYHWPQKSKIL